MAPLLSPQPSAATPVLAQPRWRRALRSPKCPTHLASLLILRVGAISTQVCEQSRAQYAGLLQALT